MKLEVVVMGNHCQYDGKLLIGSVDCCSVLYTLYP
jgi:hypothetical protein